MAEWTRAQVEDRLESAADVMRALPGAKPQGYFSAWPEYLHTFADKVGQQPAMRRPQTSPRAITEAEEAMLWLRWLEPELGNSFGPGSPARSGSRSAGGSEPPALRPTNAWSTGQRHCLAVERAAGAGKAIAAVRGGGGAGRMMLPMAATLDPIPDPAGQSRSSETLFGAQFVCTDRVRVTAMQDLHVSTVSVLHHRERRLDMANNSGFGKFDGDCPVQSSGQPALNIARPKPRRSGT